MRELAGFRAGCEGAQDWDLFLRISEKTESIHHIPKILYSWRKHGGSTSHHYEAKPYVFDAQEKSLGDRLRRTGEAGKVRKGIFEGLRALEYTVDGSPTISILLAVTHPGRAERCARHLSQQHGTLAMDLILLHDNSISEGQLKRIPGKPLMTTGPMTVGFNQAAKRVTSDFIVFLTDQNEFMDDAWLARLVADGQRAGAGFVGGAVVYANQPEIVKSAGLTLDPGRIHAPLLNGLHRLRMGGLAWLYGSCRRNVIGLELSGALVSRQKFLDAGGFNAELPTSYAATDLMLRMHSQGLRHIYTPFVVVKDGATSRRQDEKPVEPPRAVLEHFHAQWRSAIENDPYVNAQFLRNPHLQVN